MPGLPAELLPATESLKITLDRVMPYWGEAIAPQLREGKNVIVAAHGNSLRALAKHLFKIGDQDIIGLEIPTGNPILVELDDALRPISARYLDAERAGKLPATAPEPTSADAPFRPTPGRIRSGASRTLELQRLTRLAQDHASRLGMDGTDAASSGWSSRSAKASTCSAPARRRR